MLLDVGQQFGDVLFIFLAVPVHFVSSLYHRWLSRGKVEEIPVEEPPVIPEYQEDVPPEDVFGTARVRRVSCGTR